MHVATLNICIIFGSVLCFTYTVISFRGYYKYFLINLSLHAGTKISTTAVNSSNNKFLELTFSKYSWKCHIGTGN